MEVSRSREIAEGKLSDLLAVIFDTLRRRWKVLALVTVLGVIAAVAAAFMMTPRYAAVARVQIDPSRSPVAARNNGGKSEELSPEAIETEVSVIRSLEVARQVVIKLKLENDAEFSKGAETLTKDGKVTFVANELLKSLDAKREKLTYIIAIAALSRDSQKASRIANAFADTYLETKIATTTGNAKSQVDFFRARIEKLQAEVREADQQVAGYRAAAGIVGSGNNNSNGVSGGTISDQQVGPLSSQLATAESDAASARATLAAAEAQAARGGLDAVAEVRSSLVVGELRRQRADLLRNIGEVQSRYGDKHPESLKIRGQLETVDQQIKEEGERVLGSLRSRATSTAAQVASLRASMGRLEGQRTKDMRASVTADGLEREAAAKRAEYDRLSQMLLESTQNSQNSMGQATIIERADPPANPASPNKPLLIVFGLVIGCAAGLGTIATQELLVTGLRTASDVEEQLGLKLLAAVPLTDRSVAPENLPMEKPTSIYSEAFRIARAAILGTRGDSDAKVIALTSALPNEGKTTSALSFARSMAISNIRTLLIECDVRRAAISPMLTDPPGGPGLVEYLHGEASLEQVLHPSGIANLDHILVSEPYFSPDDLFGGGQMRDLLDAMAERYDRVVLDLPPLAGLADGRFLSSLADTVVVVVRWDGTPAKAVASAVDWLRTDGATISGVLFSMVASTSPAMGGYYYNKEYAKYYQNN